MTSSLQCRAAGRPGEKILFSYWTMILSASSRNYFIALCLMWTFSSASSRSGPSSQSLGNRAAVHALFSVFSVHYLMPAGAGHQIIKKRLLRGVACISPDGSMPRGAWTARARPTLLAALIRARAGNPCEDPIVSEGVLYFFFIFFLRTK